MRRFFSCLTLLVCTFVLFSCKEQQEGGREPVPYVKEILLNGEAPERAVLRAASNVEPSSDISIIGTRGECDALSEFLSTYDVRDNVDARFVEDGLPDFAGETFVSIADEVSFRDVVAAGDTMEVRRQTVLRVMAAIDTVTHLSPYDMEGVAGKLRSKMILLADPYMSYYGSFDVDTLFRHSGCGIEVISPLGLALDDLFAHSGGKALNVALLYNSELSDSTIYQAHFAAKAREHSNTDARCYPFAVERSDSLFYHVLEEFGHNGGDAKLDALLVADASVDMDALKIELADVVSILNESSLTYGRLLSDNFEIYDPVRISADYSYDSLRKGNMFTHNIAMPQSVTYRPFSNPNAADGSIILIPASYVQN